MESSERDLDRLFAEYRTACPEIEPGADFMPGIWRKIEARRGFWPAFEHLARVAVAVCMFACAVIGLLDFASVRMAAISEQSYAEALAAEQNSESSFYAQAVHSPAPMPEEAQ